MRTHSFVSRESPKTKTMHLITHRRLTRTPPAFHGSPLQHACEHVLVSPRNSSPTHFRMLPNFLECRRNFPTFPEPCASCSLAGASAHSLTDRRSERSLRALFLLLLLLFSAVTICGGCDARWVIKNRAKGISFSCEKKSCAV